jgi:hypothetical protein
MMHRVTAFLVAGALALGMTAAIAQYPPPGGSIFLIASVPSPTVNSESSFTVRLVASDGSAADSVACTAVIASQPGTGASVSPGSFTTASDGTATLNIQSGNTAGDVTVSVACGQISALATLTVVSGSSAGDPLPPNTGQGVATGDNGMPSSPGWLALGVIAAAAATFGIKRARGASR